MSIPATNVIFADEDGDEFAVRVYGTLTHEEALATGEKLLAGFIKWGGWRPTGAPTYRRMEEAR
jgi:hypothetical protein